MAEKILSCRIRNTMADGNNLCGGTSNCVVTQNDLRNTGDDAIAMFNRGVLEENNKITYNTVSLPWLANNIALYGGKDMEITHNWLKDTIGFGGGVNIIEGYDNTAECIIRNNIIKDSSYQGISFFNHGLLENMIIEENKIDNCGTDGIQVDAGAVGFAVIRNNEITGVKEKINNKAAGTFEVRE